MMENQNLYRRLFFQKNIPT